MKIEQLSIAFCAFTLTAAILNGAEPSATKDSMADCPMHAQHTAAMNERGDKGMGFSQAKTTHHFRVLKDGGAIEVNANDAGDETSRDQIRGHLEQIAQMFAKGNFEIPMFVHAGMPAGAAAMQEMKSTIQYHYEKTETGGRVRITTAAPKALAAVHEFLRFQITEHHTGDALDVAAR